jgi:hypothetical protein
MKKEQTQGRARRGEAQEGEDGIFRFGREAQPAR